ncbi:hypothetical protein BYT27DRAFT_6932767 [Phlegmacium glaucopus]|nr:hypothetical protein BYT27DRAFT_6932767 [Phlegmacium glaucopus]
MVDNSTIMNTRIPTVNDLRVKLCYICREEEHYGNPPEDPPRKWTHPCTCTLVAHEQCLLKWIQTSQGNASRAPNALKCPQCGTTYQLESNKPIILRVFSAGNRIFQQLGRYFTVIGTLSVIGVVGTSVYVCLTAYGLWAVQKFIGTEMFDMILTNDPSNWPWSAYINLPLLPISLVSSRFQASSLLIPLLLIWPPASSGPVGEQGRRLFEYWSKPENAARLSQMKFNPTHSWPPPPLILGVIGLPVIRVFYHRFYARLYLKCMGTPLPPPRRVRTMNFNEGPFVIRIRADGQEQNPNVELQQQQQQPPQAAAAGEDPDPNAAAAEAAEQLIEINAASLGRRIGGALIIPAISSFMGNLLFRLSKHSSILRSFLGIRPQRGWNDLNLYQKATMGFQLFVNTFSSGSRTYVDSDPVWWRNAVGFGLFIVVKDCVQLLHLWLAKRELESRRVKDRDFKGVDIRELDLLPSFYR